MPDAGSTIGLFLATLLVSLASGVVPLLSLEAYLLAVAALSPAATAPLALAAGLGQMIAKSLLYRAGGRLGTVSLAQLEGRVRWHAGRMAGSERGALALVLASALTGFPPFYGVSFAAGMVRLRYDRFFAVGCAASVLRFALLLSLPKLLL